MNSKTNIVGGNRMSNATRLLLMLVAFAATLCGVYFLAPSQRPSAAPRVFAQPPSVTPLDACSLTSPSEIATVQGVQVQSAQRSSHKQGDLVVAQCYYPAVSSDGRANLSVYLQVIRPDANKERCDQIPRRLSCERQEYANPFRIQRRQLRPGREAAVDRLVDRG